MRSEPRRWLLMGALLWCGLAAAEPLVGPAVGNADALVAEGTRLYNKKRYADASGLYLKATRANPSLLQAYLGLARARLGAKQIPGACTAYRAYLRSAPDIQERAKAQRELSLCERQLKAWRKKKKNKVPPDLTARHVELKAGFFSALEAGQLVGPDSAGEMLTTLVSEGYLGTDLGEMGSSSSAFIVGTAREQKGHS
ncbi:tetratricopeptide repeat protein, partial [Pyxidicoccus sp. 3LFB2]